MIQKETNLVVADNSGAKKVRCIHVFGGTGRRYASLGDQIIVSVKAAVPGGIVKKKDVCELLLFAVSRNRVEKTVHIFVLTKMLLFCLMRRVNQEEPVFSDRSQESCVTGNL